MFSKSLGPEITYRALNLTTIASFILAVIAYLPFGYSGSYVIAFNGAMVADQSFVNILWFSISSSYGLNQTISYLVPIVGPIALVIVMIGLTLTVRRLSVNKNVFGRYGLLLLMAGAFSLLLSGVLEAFHVPNTISSYDSYPIMARLIGIALLASGVLMTSMNISAVGSAIKRIGTLVIGCGAVFSFIFAGAVVLDQFSLVQDTGIWALLNGIEIVGISLVLLGVVLIENGLLKSFRQKAFVLRVTMILSIAVLLTGAIYLFLVNGPDIGVRTGVVVDPGTMSNFLSYLFTLGILLVLGTTIVTGIKSQKIVRKAEIVTGNDNSSAGSA